MSFLCHTVLLQNLTKNVHDFFSKIETNWGCFSHFGCPNQICITTFQYKIAPKTPQKDTSETQIGPQNLIFGHFAFFYIFAPFFLGHAKSTQNHPESVAIALNQGGRVKNDVIIGVGNPDNWWYQDYPPQDYPLVGNPEVGNPDIYRKVLYHSGCFQHLGDLIAVSLYIWMVRRNTKYKTDDRKIKIRILIPIWRALL